MGRLMAQQISRRGFVKSSLIASAAVPLGLASPTQALAQTAATPVVSTATTARETMPTGKIAGQEFSRLIMGGNLIGGWSHSRDLAYVSTLMRRYNTDAKIRETLELAETKGIVRSAVSSWVAISLVAGPTRATSPTSPPLCGATTPTPKSGRRLNWRRPRALSDLPSHHGWQSHWWLVPLARPRLRLHPYAALQHRRQNPGDA